MVDFAMDIYGQLHKDQPLPPELPERRQKVVAELKKLQVSALDFFLLNKFLQLVFIMRSIDETP